MEIIMTEATEAVKNTVKAFSVSIVTALGLGAECANYVYIFFISMLPIIELRGAIPVAFALKMPLLPSLLISIIGNLLPVPLILLFITPLCDMLKKTRALEWFPRMVEKRVSKNSEKITKYARWGLFLFVAIPLPGTGAWTGALVASFLDFKFRDAFLSIAAGVLCAGLVMCLLSYGVLGLIF